MSGVPLYMEHLEGVKPPCKRKVAAHSSRTLGVTRLAFRVDGCGVSLFFEGSAFF